MFCLLLTVQRPTRMSWLWLTTALISGLCLVLSGLKKMLGMPLMAASLIVLVIGEAYATGEAYADTMLLPSH